MNTKLLISLLIIGMVTCLAGATYAHFSDTEVSIGNTFASGTLDLKIKEGTSWTGEFYDGITETWTLSNMKPGDETSSKYVSFKNAGTADHLEITCSYTIDEGAAVESETNASNTADDMAEEMIITEIRYYNRDYTWRVDLLNDDGYDNDYVPGDGGLMVNDLNNDGKVSLYELKSQAINLRPPGETRLKMRIKFDDDADNDFQGDTLITTFIFTLNQQESQ